MSDKKDIIDEQCEHFINYHKKEETAEAKLPVNNIVRCSSCGLNDAVPEHTCPYAEDVNNDSSTLCTCCSACEHECCMDI